MRRGLPLYGRLLLWLGLNLALLVGLFLALPGRSGLGWDALLSDPVRERLVSIAALIAADLSSSPESDWPGVLDRHGTQYGIRFECCEHERPARPGPPPPRGRLPAHDAPPPPDFDDSPSRMEEPQPPPGFAGAVPRAPLERVRMVRTAGSAGVAISIPASLQDESGQRRPIDITAHASGVSVLLRFLGLMDWVTFSILALLLSALLWWPFVWGITRTTVQITRATHRIADGEFDVRVATQRRDELGQLAASVNTMAGRLGGHLSAQKQFLADVAHEVTSPLARVQIGLGVLEPHLDEAGRATLTGVQEDLEHMSGLMHELLLFSRASLQASTDLQAVALRPLIDAVVHRENAGARVTVAVDPGLRVMAQDVQLARAIANVIRNAARHVPASAPPAEITARIEGGTMELRIADHGPGVPDAALPRLGEPFYRPDTARSTDSGGFGLGLAIVRRCIQNCGGEVSFHNRPGGGFEVRMRLKAVPSL